MKRIVALLAAWLPLCGVACRTVPIPPTTVVRVPHGLTRQAVEVAMIAGILNKHPSPSYDPKKTLSDSDFDAMLARDFLATAHGRSWFPEEREGNTQYACVDTRGHYLRVAIAMSPDELRIDIVESRNLLQEDGRIHKKVPEWIDNLSAHIRRELGRLASYGTVESGASGTTDRPMP